MHVIVTFMSAVHVCFKYFCPCIKCGNRRQQSVNDIISHDICDRIIPNYTKWIWHSELPHMSTVPHTKSVDVQIDDHIEDMIRDLRQEDFLANSCTLL